MNAILDYLFGTASFMPHGSCLLWRPDLVALHAVSDAAIALSYFVIPLAIAHFMSKRQDLPKEYQRVALLFILFIVACGVTQLMALITLWVPAYGLQGIVKAGTGAVSVLTAIVLFPLIPHLAKIPSPATLSQANERLKSEIEAHVGTMRQLNEARRELERRVEERTRELTEIKQRFETALKGSDITVFSQDRDLIYRWIYNPRASVIPDAAIGHTDHDVLPGETAGKVVTAKRRVIETGEPQSVELEMGEPGGDIAQLYLRIDPSRNEAGQIEGVTCAMIDLTERRLFERRLSSLSSRLAEANARFELALRGSRATVFSQDADLVYTWIYNVPEGYVVDAILGRRDQDFLDAEACEQVVPLKREVVATGETRRVDIVTRPTGAQERARHFDLRVEAVTNDSGSVAGIAGIMLDVTERKRQEEHIRFVMRELTHRSKNLLAVIQAMARQTAARTSNPKEFVGRFSARLQAIAASHDLLVAREWHGVGLHELVTAQISQAVDPTSGQVTVEGPVLVLKPEAAQSLGLALHELTTNAAKYGALSVPGGQVHVAWSHDGDHSYQLSWREIGGPSIAAPERKGFGVMLLERTVGQSLDGQVSLEFAREGLCCRITLAASHVFAEPAH